MDLVVSVNDAKLVRRAGQDLFPDEPGADTLTVLDTTSRPLRVVRTVEVATSIVGPPQAVAVSADGRWAAVAAPTRHEPGTGLVFGTGLQVVDLTAGAPTARWLELGAHPQAVAFHPTRGLLLVTTVSGELVVCTVGETVAIRDRITLSAGRLAGVAIVADGSAALVSLRDEQGVAVLAINADTVSVTPHRVSTGVSPYAIDVDATGRWAVIGNVGWTGSAQRNGECVADLDLITLVDTAARPMRAVEHLAVPSVPEGVAISPDGRWVAALCMGGSQLPPDAPGHRPGGRLVLLENVEGRLRRADSVPAGASAQGVVFAADGRTILAQFFTDRCLAVFDLEDGTLWDTGERVDVAGGPSSLRGLPRAL